MSDLRKLLIVAGQLDTGGAERELVTFLRAVRELPLEIVVASLARSGALENEVKILTGREVECPPSATRIRRLMWMRGLVNHCRPDIIHAWNLFPLAYLAKGLFRRPCPVVGSLQHTRPQAIGEGMSPRLLRFLLQVPDGLISNSQAALDSLSELKVQPTCSAVVHNGVGEEFFIARAGRDALESRHDRLVVIGVGRLVPRKRFDWMIRLAADLRAEGQPIDLWIVGAGPERERLELLAEDLTIRETVRFWGERMDVESILPAADVYLHCAWAEGLPNSLQEAMAAGLPVVAPRIAGIPEIVVSGEEGLLYEVEDYPGCNGLLRRVLTEPSLRSQLARGGRRRAETSFRPQEMADKLLVFYSNVLANEATR